MYDFYIYYGLALLAIAVSLGAQIFISVAYAKYSKVQNSRRITGADAARLMLQRNNINGVQITRVAGNLTDHYDPSKKVVRLSEGIFSSTSVAAAAVACHECGHVLQDFRGYAFMRFRTALAPITNIASRAGYIAILIGLIMSSQKLIYVGIIAELVILLFQLVTLPVEINASRRAMNEIRQNGILTEYEYPQAKTVLIAAAMTYVAGVVTVLIQVLRLVLIFGGRRRR